MKTKSLASGFAFMASVFSALPPSAVAQFTNVFGLYDPAPAAQNLFISPSNYLSLETLVAAQLPGAGLMASCSGTFYFLANRHGDQIQISPGKPEMPQPATNAPGYWTSPIMNFLGRQKMKAATEHDAVAAVQLYLSLWRGVDYMHQKLCHARRFDDCWVVEVDHDFTNYPGNIMAVTPFELQVNSDSTVVLFRERSFNYLGSAAVYTNTINSAYEREVKIQGGMNYPEAVERELRAAWKKEQGK